MNTGLGSPLEVLHIVESLEVGGMERMVQTMCLAAEKLDVRSRVLCFRRRGLLADELETRGVRVDCLSIPEGLEGYFAFASVARYLHRRSVDVVHTHNTPGLIFGATGARLAGVRTVVHTEHGRVFPDARRRMFAERIVSTYTYRVVGVSDAISAALHRHEGIALKRLRTVPNGVSPLPNLEPGCIDAIRSSLALPLGAPTIGVASRLVWEKGIDVLLRAFALVLRDLPAAYLLIAGDGPLRKSLELLTRELGIAASVHFLGARSDVPVLLRLFDVFVLPSLSEGLPMGLLEAMAAERPIVASLVGGMPNALDDGRAGLLVAPGDITGLAVALTTLLRDRSRAAGFGKTAAQKFRARFTADVMAAGYVTMYRRADDRNYRPRLDAPLAPVGPHPRP